MVIDGKSESIIAAQWAFGYGFLVFIMKLK